MKSIFIFLVSFLIVNFINITNAQDKFEQRPIEEALNADGTLRQGVQGSFKVEGYEMHTGANGKPIFVPKTQNLTSGTWEPLGSGAQNGVNAGVTTIAIDSAGRVYVGGYFTQAGGVSANRVASFDPATNTWSALGTGAQNGVNSFVNALAIDGSGKVYVGGEFTQAGGVSANYVARFDPLTNTWSSLGTGAQNGVNGSVYSLVVDVSGRVYVGGGFTQAGGIISYRVARFDPLTNLWSVLGSGSQNGVNGGVSALAIDAQGRVYVGGSFFSLQPTGVRANYVAFYEPSTNLWGVLGTDANNGVSGIVDTRVNALAIDSAGHVYVGGLFTQASGVSVRNVARFNPATNTWTALGTGIQNGVNNYVRGLAVDGQGNIYVGGDFSQAGGVSASGVARYNPIANTWSALGSGSQQGVTGQVTSLRIDGTGRVNLGGNFTQAGGVSANRVARWTPSSTSVEKIGDDIPTKYLLSQNYPNPFNPSTTISFSIPTSEFVTLKVYDVLGREVATLVNENLSAGNYSYNFDASNLTNGVYLYKLQAGKYNEIKKMVLTK